MRTYRATLFIVPMTSFAKLARFYRRFHVRLTYSGSLSQRSKAKSLEWHFWSTGIPASLKSLSGGLAACFFGKACLGRVVVFVCFRKTGITKELSPLPAVLLIGKGLCGARSTGIMGVLRVL